MINRISQFIMNQRNSMNKKKAKMTSIKKNAQSTANV